MLIVALSATQLALRAVVRWLTELSKSTFENVFKGRLTGTLLRKDYLRVSAVHSGEWMNRLTSDTVVVANGYVEIVPGLTGMTVKLISAIIMIIVIEPIFAAILIPGGIVLALLTMLFRKVMKRLHKNVQESDGKLRIFLQERIASLLMLRSFAAEEQTQAGAAEKMNALVEAARQKGEWLVFMSHGMKRGYDAWENPEELKKHLEWVKAQPDVWVGTFGEVAAYTLEGNDGLP